MLTVNRVLLQEALAAVEKMAFVGAADPNMTGDMPPGGMPPGGMPPGDMPPGGMPPGGMPPGMDPAAMGAAPPIDPLAMLQPMITDAVQQAVQQAMQQTTAATGAAAKAKLDVATELHQLKMMMGKMLDVMGVPLSASEMFSAPQPPQLPAAAAQPAADPAAAGGGGLGRVLPMKAAEYEYGDVFEPAAFRQESAEAFYSTAERAKAVLLKSYNV